MDEPRNRRSKSLLVHHESGTLPVVQHQIFPKSIALANESSRSAEPLAEIYPIANLIHISPGNTLDILKSVNY